MTDHADVQTEAEIEAPTHRIDRDIYAMPAFGTLEVADLDRARSWYEDLGFVVSADMGAAGLLHLRRYRYQDLLLVPSTGPRRAGRAGMRISFAHTRSVEERESVAAALRERGDGEVAGPTTTPWYSLDVTATDPDGHVVVLTPAACSRRRTPSSIRSADPASERPDVANDRTDDVEAPCHCRRTA